MVVAMQTLSVLCLSLAVVCVSKADKLNEYVHHYEHVQLSPSITAVTASRLTANIEFRAHNRQFLLRLQTNSQIFAEGFKLRVHHGGKIHHTTVDTSNIVRGYMEGEFGSLVHGRVTAHHFEGVIHTEDETYHVEPMHRYHPGSPAHSVVVYKSSDVHYDVANTWCNSSLEHSRLRRIQKIIYTDQQLNVLQTRCKEIHYQQVGHLGSLERTATAFKESAAVYNMRYGTDNVNRLKRRQSGAPGDKNTCTIHVYADYLFYTNVGESDVANTLATMATHITFADTVYRATGFNIDGSEVTGYGVSIQGADVITDGGANDNPLFGDFATDDLLEAFSSYYTFNDVCLGHLFTYRDFRGTVGLAYVADPSGRLAGGICERRTQTFGGEKNLNTGFTSLLNFGRRLPQSVSTIITTHEIGHNFGSPHDSTGECAPGGSQGNYIMYASATDGSLPNNKQFSSCSKQLMGQTIGAKSNCFQRAPLQQECGNGIVEGDEMCDCGTDNATLCAIKDPCCVAGNCTLLPGADCSPAASVCCNNSCKAKPATELCRMGDGECLEKSYCDGENFTCPQPQRNDGIFCNDESNVCEDGVCSGSVCRKQGVEATPCFCSGPDNQTLCQVCCIFNLADGCVSTFTYPGLPNATIQPGFPCANFTGYCNDERQCVVVDTNKPLDDLRNLIPSLTSIVEWLQYNWYYVLGGLGVTILIIILLQVTYRRKNLKKKAKDKQRGRRRIADRSTPEESATLLTDNRRGRGRGGGENEVSQL